MKSKNVIMLLSIAFFDDNPKPINSIECII
jgi:hypothetical protein